MTDKRYEGTPESADYDMAGRVDVFERVRNGWDGCPLPACHDEVNHSPTGFGWGYGGSGPAQLAYAILRDFTNSATIARANYQRFKGDIVARLPRGSWKLDGDQVREWIDANVEQGVITYPVDVDSSAITRVDYDPDTLTLVVTFTSRISWAYFGVAEETAAELVTAESVGRYFHAHIKAQYEAEKCEEETA